MSSVTNRNKTISKFITLEVSPIQADIIQGLVERDMSDAQASYRDGRKLRDVQIMDSANDRAIELQKILNRIEAHA